MNICSIPEINIIRDKRKKNNLYNYNRIIKTSVELKAGL